MLYAGALRRARPQARVALPPRPRELGVRPRPLGIASPQASALADCTRLFEGAVYGDAPVAADDVRRADALAQAMLA